MASTTTTYAPPTPAPEPQPTPQEEGASNRATPLRELRSGASAKNLLAEDDDLAFLAEAA